MKKAIELSLNFLVTIIIALVIFGFGIKYIYNLASEAGKLKDLTFEDLDKRIEDLLCESTDKVCIGTTKKVIQRGDFDVFGIKIINALSADETFGITVKPGPGYAKDNTEIPNNLESKSRSEVSIKSNEEAEVGIGIQVPRDNVVSGTYIFNIEIYYEGGTESYDTLQKIYVEVP